MNSSATPAKSGIVNAAVPLVCAAIVVVTRYALASATVSRRPPLVLPSMSINPVFVLPVASVRLGVVAALIDTAPLSVFAPVDVMNVPVDPANVFAALPLAVNPVLITGAVRVLFVNSCVAARPTTVSAPAKKVAEVVSSVDVNVIDFGNVIVLAAVISIVPGDIRTPNPATTGA